MRLKDFACITKLRTILIVIVLVRCSFFQIFNELKNLFYFILRNAAHNLDMNLENCEKMDGTSTLLLILLILLICPSEGSVNL